MIDTKNFHDRRLRLEASFDGPIPKHRLPEPAPRRKPADARTVMRSLGERRRILTAAEAKSDAVLARLSQHLQWLVRADRRQA